MIYHILLHISSLIIGVFLSAVSVVAYLRNQSARLLFMTFGFLSLVVVEIFYLLSSAQGIRDIIFPVTEIELTHIILLTMLTLFVVGVFKMNNRF
jgi:hypothetical protein